GLGTDRINWNGGRLKQADPQVLTIPRCRLSVTTQMSLNGGLGCESTLLIRGDLANGTRKRWCSAVTNTTHKLS
ncbi:hypothetical protein ACJH6J_27940, partial [Mycobacterium sp. SMC-18]|uniref:hypothetical protein n=1 Tax=unclassified Mycobacterium TaxID=2642494 RepID=UPI0038762A1E